ncbi:retinoblastoma-binding protein 5 [Phaethornis superciliosus]
MRGSPHPYPLLCPTPLLLAGMKPHECLLFPRRSAAPDPPQTPRDTEPNPSRSGPAPLPAPGNVPSSSETAQQPETLHLMTIRYFLYPDPPGTDPPGPARPGPHSAAPPAASGTLLAQPPGCPPHCLSSATLLSAVRLDGSGATAFPVAAGRVEPIREVPVGRGVGEGRGEGSSGERGGRLSAGPQRGVLRRRVRRERDGGRDEPGAAGWVRERRERGQGGNGGCGGSFGQNYPEEADGTLDCISMALTCTFNRWGTLLAVGCNDGRIVIWDFLTRGIAKIISAHIHPVCSLCWSRDGHKLASASTDNIVSQWDVLSGDCDQRFRFPSPILKVQYHPRDQNRVLVCPMKSAPVMLTLSDSKHVVLPVDDDSDLNVVASFDRRGDYIYTGNAKGKILVLKTDTQDLVASFRVTTGTSNTTAIKSIEFARKGSCFLINTADRIIRVYDGREILTCGRDGEPEPMQKLQDLVNRTPWKKCCFSGDGEYIVAGSARQHALYIWEKSIGNLVKILHGTRGELLLDVAWHPVRPIIASISSGVVSIWAQNQVENWSAFAPDFKELDENVEYEERESEFDIEDEDKSEPEQTGADAAEDEEVDVTSVDPIAAFCSSDEELEDSKALLYLPIAPEVEDPEENPYGPPPDAVQSSLTDEGLGSEKKRQSSSDGPQAPKKKPKTTNIELQGVPNDEVHPLLGVKGDGKSKKKQAGRPKGSKGKDKDSPFKPKLYKGDRGALPLEGAAKGKVQAELGQPLTAGGAISELL